MKHVSNDRGAVSVLAIVLVVVVVAAVGFAVYNASQARNKGAQSVTGSPSPATSPGADASPAPASLKTYSNSDFGLTFQYPSEYGEVSLTKDVGPYTSGPRFTGTFSGNSKLKFIVTSATYRDEGTNLLNTFRGYYESGGKTYYKWADSQYTGASPVQISNPVKTLSVGGRKILIVNDSSMVHIDGPANGPGAGNIAGLANLSGSTYPGVVFVTSISADELEQILNTLKL